MENGQMDAVYVIFRGDNADPEKGDDILGHLPNEQEAADYCVVKNELNEKNIYYYWEKSEILKRH
jgi:hypothetical protein